MVKIKEFEKSGEGTCGRATMPYTPSAQALN